MPAPVVAPKKKETMTKRRKVTTRVVMTSIKSWNKNRLVWRSINRVLYRQL